MTSKNLKKRREKLDLSQSQLAEVLGIHTRTVSAWETDRQSIPAYLGLALSRLEQIHETYGSVDHMLKKRRQK